jgi:hypothetical protein
VVDCLPSKHEAPSSIPNMKKKKEEKEKKEKEKK